MSDGSKGKQAIICLTGVLGSELFTQAEVDLHDYFPQSLLNTRPYLHTNIHYPKGYRIWISQKVKDKEWLNLHLLKRSVRRRVRTDTLLFKLKPDGTPLVPSGEIDPDADRERFGASNKYRRLVRALQREFGSEYGNENIQFFPLDWRFSVEVSAGKLEDYINERNYESVVLVAHSLGGLVACSFIARNAENKRKVNKLITIGTPYLGSAKVLQVIATGDMLDDMKYKKRIFSAPLKEVTQTITSTFEMLPSARYFSMNSAWYVLRMASQNGSAPSDGYVPVKTHEETSQLINTTWAYRDPAFIAQQQKVQESFFVQDEHVSKQVDSYYIIGYGKQTIESITLKQDVSGQYTKIHNMHMNKEGDDQVQLISSTIGGTIAQSRSFFIRESHIGLVTNRAVIDLVKNIVRHDAKASPIGSIPHSRKVTHICK